MTEKTIELFTAGNCRYCEKAIELLKSHGCRYTQLDVTENEKQYKELLQRLPGVRTLPQVFIDGRSIGSYEDLVALLRDEI